MHRVRGEISETGVAGIALPCPGPRPSGIGVGSSGSWGVTCHAPAGLEHRRANEDDPWKELLKIADPVERAAVASKTGFPLTEADLSSVILEAVASRPTEAQRAAIALVLYLSLRSSRRIAATAAETLASQLKRVLCPFTTTHKVYGKELQNCREVASLCSGLKDTLRDNYTRNLLNAFLPGGYEVSLRRSCTPSSSGSGSASG